MRYALFRSAFVKHALRAYFLAAIGSYCCLAAGLILSGATYLNAHIAAINITTGLLFVFDKLISPSRLARVPEKLILALSVAGGTPAVLLGLIIIRHKSAKPRFLVKLIIVLLIQFCILRLFGIKLK
ncbi:MAG: DUF1294 domain-containing protein [Candidatus Dadabacteria bacterium]|nr:MAG: DUF1294 domain-containing protein [Candidatus Dadabacteria bacterium]